MLKSILNAVVSALKQGFRMLGRVAGAPFRALAAMMPGGAGGGMPQIDVPEVEPPVAVEAAAPGRAEAYQAIVDAVMTWCADSIIDDVPAYVPPDLPPSIREWLPGLTREECYKIIDTNAEIVKAHIRGPFPIPGVRPVQRLSALREWLPEPSRGRDPADGISACCEPAPPPIHA